MAMSLGWHRGACAFALDENALTHACAPSVSQEHGCDEVRQSEPVVTNPSRFFRQPATPKVIHRSVRILVGLFVTGGISLASSSADVQNAIQLVKPSVVIVGTFKLTNNPRFNLRGSGFVVGDGNWAVTNAHVIPDGADFDPESKIVVQVRTGQNDLQMRQATVLEIDKLHDLALLQFDGAAVPKLTLRDSNTVREGQAIAFQSAGRSAFQP